MRWSLLVRVTVAMPLILLCCMGVIALLVFPFTVRGDFKLWSFLVWFAIGPLLLASAWLGEWIRDWGAW
jgi:hypothetical protein